MTELDDIQKNRNYLQYLLNILDKKSLKEFKARYVGNTTWAIQRVVDKVPDYGIYRACKTAEDNLFRNFTPNFMDV